MPNYMCHSTCFPKSGVTCSVYMIILSKQFQLKTAVTQVFKHGVVSRQDLLVHTYIHFTVSYISLISQDVLDEVNSDYSNSIEFYEYLLLSKKCLDLTGRHRECDFLSSMLPKWFVVGTSDLFHNELIAQQHEKFAEMCCIQ